MLTQIGQNLKEARKDLGLTQVEVAKAMQITQMSLSYIEKGERYGKY